MLAIAVGVCLLSTLPAAQGPFRPQDDLYAYANADWLAHTTIPEDRVTLSGATELVDGVEQRLRDIIEDLAAVAEGERDPEEDLIVALYTSVTDRETVEGVGLGPVRADLDRIERADSIRDIATIAGRLTAAGEGGPFEVTLLASRTPDGPIARVQPGGILLPDPASYVTPSRSNLTLRREYAQYLSTLFQAAGLEQARADDEAGAVVAFETRLADAMIRSAIGPEITRARQLSDFERQWTGFTWRDWARPIGLDRAAGIVLTRPEFFEEFAALVQKASMPTLRAWLRGRFLTAMAPYLPEAIASARFDFFGTFLTGQQIPREAWKRGVSLVSSSLGDAIGRRYVERHFPSESRTRVRRLVHTVLATARDGVAGAPWLSADERREAQRRIDTIEAQVGYPDKWRSYAYLHLSPDDLIGNIRRLRSFESQYRVRRARAPSISREWLMPAQAVNAYYSPGQHQIALPAGVLQSPFFDPEADDAVNFGAVGAVVGHELSHALILRGLAPRAQTLRRQFSGFEILPGLPVNTALTTGESLADVVGLQLAYRAYQRSLEGRAPPTVGGLSGDQRFFLAWARLWKSQTRPEYVRASAKSSRYAPPRLRANGTVVHVDAFHEAFDVHPGDRMFVSPDARLRVW
jgi:putative endopeptidase